MAELLNSGGGRGTFNPVKFFIPKVKWTNNY
jgi:hypothetical protein